MVHSDALARALDTPFGTIPALIRLHAQTRPAHAALIQDDHRIDYAGLDARMDGVAAALQREGLAPRTTIAICADTSIAYCAVFLGSLRAGLAVAPLASSSSPESLVGMLEDAQAQILFADRAVLRSLEALRARLPLRIVTLDDSEGGQPLSQWLGAPPDSRPEAVAIQSDWPFNIIYSSGTTGAPKGIVQPHSMRWTHVQRARNNGYDAHSVTLTSTPLYSNTTLVSFLPTIALGGCAVLMAKFEAGRYLELAQRHRTTHTMLVPVQYQRIMAREDFGDYDLTSFRMKFCTSAPFPAALKADILQRWPGGLIEYYGMTEGGGTCILAAHAHPDKLHTVGRPAPGHDIRLIDEAGREVAPGEAGEVVGHSPGMMDGYHGQPEKTRAAEWHDANGKRFIRTGDIGRFDSDGFLMLIDRKKDMIISGGFNIYPSDLEAVLGAHPDVREASVIGVPSERWGETPVAFVVLRAAARCDAHQLMEWANAQLGKTQRLAGLRCVESLPRNAIGKVLKRELREQFQALG